MERQLASGERWLDEHEAASFFERTSELERERLYRLTMLKESALEAGFGEEAVRMAAFEQIERKDLSVPPDWVRFVLLGVPDREGAMMWYRLLCIVGVVCSTLAVLKPTWLETSWGLIAGLWFLSCAASISAAIRWMERHAFWGATKGEQSSNVEDFCSNRPK